MLKRRNASAIAWHVNMDTFMLKSYRTATCTRTAYLIMLIRLSIGVCLARANWEQTCSFPKRRFFPLCEAPCDGSKQTNAISMCSHSSLTASSINMQTIVVRPHNINGHVSYHVEATAVL